MAVPKLRFKADDGCDYLELTVAKLDDLCEKIGDGYMEHRFIPKQAIIILSMEIIWKMAK